MNDDFIDSSPTSPEAGGNIWICPNCGATCHGNFCGPCGTIAPHLKKVSGFEEVTWICPNCGDTCHGRFCGVCGRPYNDDKGVFIASDGKQYTFNALELFSITESLNASMITLSTILTNLSSECSSISTTVSSSDSGLSSSLNNLGNLCGSCKSLLVDLLSVLVNDINNYVDKTVANEESNAKDIKDINDSLADISSIFDSIGK